METVAEVKISGVGVGQEGWFVIPDWPQTKDVLRLKWPQREEKLTNIGTKPTQRDTEQTKKRNKSNNTKCPLTPPHCCKTDLKQPKGGPLFFFFFFKGFKKDTKLLVMQTHLVLTCYYNNPPQPRPPTCSSHADKSNKAVCLLCTANAWTE